MTKGNLPTQIKIVALKTVVKQNEQNNLHSCNKWFQIIVSRMELN